MSRWPAPGRASTRRPPRHRLALVATALVTAPATAQEEPARPHGHSASASAVELVPWIGGRAWLEQRGVAVGGGGIFDWSAP